MLSLSIRDKDYSQWVNTLVERYHQRVIRASIKVNTEQLIYNFLLGRDIVEMHVEERWGYGVITQLSNDLKREMPTIEGLSATNLRYCRRFYLLYSQLVAIRPQIGGKFTEDMNFAIRPQIEGELSASEMPPYAGALFSVPWGHLSVFPNMNWRNSIRRKLRGLYRPSKR
ncbi:MAG: hypothetical protein IJU36_01545 [Paludibacteraceae bacterium]|nr:hypothetical protein [Paludibacteraceae bacterium]